jgi:hypothetical protein
MAAASMAALTVAAAPVASARLLVSPIERVYNNGNEKSFKLLGVYFDEYLSFDDHINHLCNKLSKSLYCQNKVKNFVSAEALTKLYFALVHSSITY